MVYVPKGHFYLLHHSPTDGDKNDMMDAAPSARGGTPC